jgi:hypothetical protein
MVRRRRATRRRAPRTFGINVIETGTALALISQVNAGAAVTQFLGGNLNAGISTISKGVTTNKQAIIKTLIGSMVAKVAVKTLSRGSPVLASLGPIKVRA